MKPLTLADQPLAVQGGPKAVESSPDELFHWPIVTEEDEQAILAVLRAGSMSQTGLTRQFEAAWGEYLGTRFNLGHCSGTAALQTAMFAVGLGRGDEMIVPSLTYWASAAQASTLGATPVFADVHPDTVCIDPADIERHISKRTKAIMVVHYCGFPCDMDAIMAIARKHGLKVIEDNSHAHGSLYKGRKAGALADVSAMSMMSRKSFAIGEAGMLCTDNREIYERAVAFSHYERMPDVITSPALTPFVNVPLGGQKHRMNQWSAAMGLVQLKHYPARIQEIERAMLRFWSLLEGVPGVKPLHTHLPANSTLGGWYAPRAHYRPEELGGLSAERFTEAVRAEGSSSSATGNFPLHLHPTFNDADVYRDGKPTRIAFSDRDVRQPRGSLPVTERIDAGLLISIPWFKHDWPEHVERHAAAFRKVALRAADLR